MKYIILYKLSFYFLQVEQYDIEQLADDAHRRMKTFQFWFAFNAMRWPTDLVSSGQVEAIDRSYISVTCLVNINRK